MKQFNGEKGCSVCEDEGKTIGTGGLHRIWPYTTNMVLRTHNSVVESVRKVIQTGKPVGSFVITDPRISNLSGNKTCGHDLKNLHNLRSPMS